MLNLNQSSAALRKKKSMDSQTEKSVWVRCTSQSQRASMHGILSKVSCIFLIGSNGFCRLRVLSSCWLRHWNHSRGISEHDLTSHVSHISHQRAHNMRTTCTTCRSASLINVAISSQCFPSCQQFQANGQRAAFLHWACAHPGAQKRIRRPFPQPMGADVLTVPGHGPKLVAQLLKAEGARTVQRAEQNAGKKKKCVKKKTKQAI